MSGFEKPLIDLIQVWHDDRNLSKILCGTISTTVHDLKVKVTEFLCSIFTVLVFAKP